MDYKEYSYLYPPRPEKKIPSDLLKFYETSGWWGQVKKNGTCTVIFAKKDQVIFKTRHADDHKMWVPDQKHLDFFKTGEEWNVFTAELQHSKTPNVKNHLYIFDWIVINGRQAVDQTFAQRQEQLHDRWNGDLRAHDVLVHEHVSVARSFGRGLSQLWHGLVAEGLPENEGLVLKLPTAKLKPCFRANSNDAWQAKCRVPHKNYSF